MKRTMAFLGPRALADADHHAEADHHADADTLLAAALIAREPAAATRAWTRFSPLVFSILRRQLGRDVDERDLCQEVFLRFFRRIDELRNPSALRGFVAGISLGIARNERRRARIRRCVSLTATGELPAAGAQETDMESREALHRLHRLLARTDAGERTIFVARFVEKREMAEIAIATGRPLGTIKRHVAVAARRLSAKMRNDPALAIYATQPRKAAGARRSNGSLHRLRA